MSDLSAPDDAGTGPVRPRVAVLFGGRSSEHAISCVTAGSVLASIDPQKYDVVPIGIAKDGRWVLEDGDTSRLAIEDPDKLPEVDGTLPVLSIAQDGLAGSLVVHPQGDVPATLGRVDVVFPVLHGPFGEDGTIQGLLEIADVRYVGAGVLASAVGMDKHYMKVVFESAGLPVLPYAVITDREWRSDPDACRAEVDALGYPVFVKPCRGGSSIGISKVRSRDELDAAVEEARRWDPKVVVEAAAGEGAREIECGVLESLGGELPEASVVAEIVVQGDHDFYDFAAKYLPEESTRLDVPADLDPTVADEVRALSVAAFEALSCEGLARVDFFLLADGRLAVNEINTMPGFTPTSMFPRMWAASGLAYPDLVDRLLRLALQRPTGLR
ncbi:D-alanine--D-alanine ligase family protein [Nocardioides caldifontis]|uniref:D-alanine--D-alanine ligase family protein n=1 Tax=Nocardioides caldifontis TaxID=2588938 RepID=UPI0011E0199A|nr:D-alanine--D-alanine ligase family protein [Nocardioides caldifontis]